MQKNQCAQMGVQGTAAECLKYHVDPNVVMDVLTDKYVPIYKILPGFRDEGSQIVLLGNQLVAGGDASSRRLDKQPLTVNQLVFDAQTSNWRVFIL